jgi:hypothetical protein
MFKVTRFSLCTFALLLAMAPAISVFGRDDEVSDANAPGVRLRVDGQRIKRTIEWLAQDKLEGRQTFTAGYRKAAQWAAARFKEWGLEPAGENGTFFQEVPIKRTVMHRVGWPELRIQKASYLLEEGDFSVHDVSTAGTTVHAEVVFVGFGISAPDDGLDEYADVEVEGKVALILKGIPVDSDGDPETEEHAWQAFLDDTVKIKTAYDRGAAAVLFYDSRTEDQRQKDARERPAPNQDALDVKRDFLAFTISDRVLRNIMKPDRQESLRGFDRRLKKMILAMGDAKPQSQPTGLQIRLKGYTRIEEYSEARGNNRSPNVLAKIVGSDPELKDQAIVLGGHLDHLGIRNGYIYNGADDNASGTAAVMEVARVLAEAGFKPKRTLVFACWTGEEMGLHGSKYFVEHPCGGVSIDKIVGSFNMDMVGLGQELPAAGALNFPSIWEVIKRGQDEDVMSIVKPATGGPGGSDHSAFIKQGIETVFLITHPWGDHPDYHKPEDDAAKIDPEMLRKAAQFTLQGTVNLANETDVNLLIEDRKSLYEGMRLVVTNINQTLSDSVWNTVELDSDSPEILRWRLTAIKEKPKRSLTRGLGDVKIFAGDVDLLLDTAEAFGCGRVDLQRSDGVWIKQGRLTRQGRYLLGRLEERRIVVHLSSPSPALLRGAIDAATRPLVVTGVYELNESLRTQINEKDILLGVKFDPQKVDACVERLEAEKAALGDTDNLLLFLSSKAELDQGKQALYLRLIKQGWTPEEIGSDRGWRERPGAKRTFGIAGGNLSVLLK